MTAPKAYGQGTFFVSTNTSKWSRRICGAQEQHLEHDAFFVSS
jgi:hypothetical protein